MSELHTPETDAELSALNRYCKDDDILGELADFARKLERERDEARERNLQLILERERWKVQAEEKIALRREIEEILGVESNQASDKQLMAGVDALRKLKRERDEAMAQLKAFEDELSKFMPTLAKLVAENIQKRERDNRYIAALENLMDSEGLKLARAKA